MNAVKPAAPKKYLRPWNTDAMGEIIASTKTSITVRYKHDPQRTHVIGKREIDSIGRIVSAGEFS